MSLGPILTLGTVQLLMATSQAEWWILGPWSMLEAFSCLAGASAPAAHGFHRAGAVSSFFGTQ